MWRQQKQVFKKESMRAYQVIRMSGVDGLEISEVPTPQLGWNQLLVKVAAASINDFNRMILTGAYPFALQLPVLPLRDGVGEVVDLGPGVTRFRIGDRVAGNFLPRASIVWTMPIKANYHEFSRL